MKIGATAILTASPDKVYEALNDPAVLVRTIPGCHQLTRTGPDEYRMSVVAGVASIKGEYAGTVVLSDHQKPTSFRMRASGSGAPGTVDADVLVTLAPGENGGTLLTYDADAVVGGMVGGVGQRMLTGVAKKTANEFFANVDRLLADPSGAAQATAAPAAAPQDQAREVAAAPTAAAPDAPAGEVFTAPAAVARTGAGSGDQRANVLLPALAGAALALVGVLLGAVIRGGRS